ncbi:MAG TPA: histidine phosphatase family protein [Symbiobacteriaceae bacterium]|nr:histidine phosphatase family protein [Symbiobacteriaceae bacterium]
MTTFYIIRHGETDYNRNGRYQGQMDIPLNEDGRRQSEMIADRMATVALDAIYSSDLSRAQVTARIIARGREVALEPRLREIHVGRVMGMSNAEIRQQFPEFWTATEQDPDHTPFPGGESAVDLQRRTMEAMAAIAARYPDGRVAVVTHGGVIKVIAASVMEMPLAIRPKIVLDNCSLTVVEWSDRGRRVRSLNDTGHLAQAPCDVRADF